LKAAKKKGWKIKGIKLDGFAGIMSHATQPGRYFADELSGRVKVIACIDDEPNLAVSDFPEAAGFTEKDWSVIKKECGCKYTDTMVVSWGPEEDVNTALAEIKIRAVEATRGVPHETRQALAGEVTTFERILPGPDRMYPDTDSLPVNVTEELLTRLRSESPQPAYEIKGRWHHLGVSEEIARKAIISPYKNIFDRLITQQKIPYQFAWSALKRLGFNKFTENGHHNGRVLEIFEYYEKDEISKDSLLKLLDSFYRDIGKDLSDVMADHKLIDVDSEEVKSLIKEYADETADMRFHNGKDQVNYICGRIKDHFGGRVDGGRLRVRLSLK
jgi:glutamyl-tRNA(Gln) amidotransferase subunit E